MKINGLSVGYLACRSYSEFHRNNINFTVPAAASSIFISDDSYTLLLSSREIKFTSGYDTLAIQFIKRNMNTHCEQPKNIAIIPMLYMKDLAAAIDFYKKAFGAKERWRIDHAGNVHVAEMSISRVLFRMHEEVTREKELSPSTLNATSIVIGLLVDNPDEVAARAVAVGATELSPVQDYEYGYRQGTIRDPFGHHWCLERMDDFNKTPLMIDERQVD